MLGRLLTALIAAAALSIGLPSSSLADGHQICWQETDPNTGEVKLVCEDRGDHGGGGGGGGTGGSSSCTYAGREIPCTGPEGAVWGGAVQCWVGEVAPGNDGMSPPPGKKKSDGAWHICYYPPPALSSSWDPVWIESGTVTIDPVVLANRAIASMDLDPITIGIVPESGAGKVGLVGLPVWMWVKNQNADTWGPITKSASQGPVSVSATARVSSIIWDMGDGNTVTCTGPGTPYADHYGKNESPTCGHRYESMSTDRPNGSYQVTATSHWVVEWSGGGQSGTIELDLTTEPLPIRVGEAQVLTH